MNNESSMQLISSNLTSAIRRLWGEWVFFIDGYVLRSAIDFASGCVNEFAAAERPCRLAKV